MRLIVTAVISSTLLLTACAPIGSSETPEIVPTASASADREASIRGTEVCVQNNSSMNMRITWRGFDAPKALPPAARQCNSGYETGDTPDVQATLEYEPAATPDTWLKIGLWASNPWSARPEAATWFAKGDKSYGMCGGFDDGEMYSFTADDISAQLTRIADTDDNKEFVLNLTDAEGLADAPDVTECVKEPSPRPL